MRSELFWITSLSVVLAFQFCLQNFLASWDGFYTLQNRELLLTKSSKLWQRRCRCHLRSHPTPFAWRSDTFSWRDVHYAEVALQFPSTSACGQVKLCLYFRIQESSEEWEIGVNCGDTSGMVPADMGFDSIVSVTGGCEWFITFSQTLLLETLEPRVSKLIKLLIDSTIFLQ